MSRFGGPGALVFRRNNWRARSVLLAAPDELRLLLALRGLPPHGHGNRHHHGHDSHGHEKGRHRVACVAAPHLHLMHPSTILVREMVARAARAMLSVTLLAALAACDKVPLTAPTESTITLYANGTSVPLNGGVDVIATVIEDAGTPVQNGTVVTFTTTLGRFEPAEARTNSGKATARLVADGRSGTATVFATSGGARSEELTLPVGGAAAESIILRATPSTVSGTGGTVQIVATVRDEGGNGLSGVLVSFSADAGQLSNGSATTDANGEARVSLTTARTTRVTANAGTQSGEITINYIASPTVSVTVTPTTPAAGEAVVFDITVTPPADGAPIQSITVDFDDGTTVRRGVSGARRWRTCTRGAEPTRSRWKCATSWGRRPSRWSSSWSRAW